jgi:asparagine synthase (glutamine-hydrolysing)
LGHRRLAIIDVSEGGKQPKTDAIGRYTITFNGEIFNFKELKKQLVEYPYTTESDTEVILAAYTKYGCDCPKYLKGQFAFAIWDSTKQELFIARDRMGEKPFYYFLDESKFSFASEIRALLKLVGKTPKLRNESLAEYLYLQSVQAPYTLLEGILQLPAAHYGIVKQGFLTISPYWDVTEVAKQDYSDLKAVHKNIKEKLSESVQLQMLSDVPLGAFLSGGIDSSAVVALMAEHSEKPVETFSVGFDEASFDESQFATLVAKKFNTNHHTIRLKSDDFVQRIPEILSKVDNPSGDGPNTFIVSEAVKKAGLTVALSGLGGDELFAGYDGFKRYYNLQKFRNIWQWSNGPWFDGKKGELLSLPKIDLEDVYPLSRSLFSLKEIKRLLPESSYQYRFPNHTSVCQLPILSQYSIAELTGYTQTVLLKDTDQMSMANSLEVRVPFFDYELIEYVLGVPDEIKYPTYPKSLLVESLKPLLPDAVVHRPKMGFSFPWEEWMKGDLKLYCQDSIEGLARRNIFSTDELSNIWNSFINNSPKVKWSKVWLLVTLEQWLRKIEL